MKTIFHVLKKLLLKTALLSLIPFSASGATVINETFASSPAANFTVVSGGTWAVTGGKYVLSSPASASSGNGNISVHNTSVSGDYTLTVDGNVTATSALWNDFSVIFGYQNATNYYYFSSNESNDAGTSGIFKVSGGTATQLADVTTLITGGTIYAVKIVKTGSTYQAYRNNVLLATATDSTWAGGKVGFGTLNDGASYDNLLVNTAGDTTPPSTPTGLAGTAVSTSQINLTWNASTDNVGVTGYQVFRGASLAGSPTATSFNDTGRAANTSYTYTVKAKDAANNLSAASSPVTVTTMSNSGPPAEVASWGPNGTHWPSVIPTPFMYDTSVPNIIFANCTWADIGNAIASVTSTQAAQGVLILVAPGTLPGNGAGSTSTPVLQNLGSNSWSKRITIAPRDGYGTVDISAGARILKVNGVCFAGFIGTAIQFQACNRSAIAWTKLTAWLGSYGTTGETTTDVEFVEVVLPTYYVGTGDTADIYSAGGTITNYRITGCYMAPRYRPSGSSSHTDTLQFATGAGGGTYSNMQIRDSAFFASSNAAIQTGSMVGMTVTNSYVAGRTASLSRYPFPTGANTGTAEGRKVFNGGGTCSGYNAIDSVFIGDSVYDMPTGSHLWTTVTNTEVNQVYSTEQQPINGAWTVDTTMGPTNPPMPPDPTDAYLNSIWQ